MIVSQEQVGVDCLSRRGGGVRACCELEEEGLSVSLYGGWGLDCLPGGGDDKGLYVGRVYARRWCTYLYRGGDVCLYQKVWRYESRKRWWG